jgi:heme/copper-type cytochrome/quinol oxidase subunit 2
MNWRRLFRLWIVGTVLFVLAVAFICYSESKSHAEVPWAKLEMCATIAFGIPLVVLILGWAFLGSAAERP